MGVGIASVIAPAYIAECSPAPMRGRLGSFQQLAIVLGIFIALLSDYSIAAIAGSATLPFWFGMAAWRWMCLTAAFPALIYGIAALTLPESPRYLVEGREQEASTILTRILGGNVSFKVEEIRQTVLKERRPNLSDLLGKNGRLLPIVWVGIGLSVFQQFVGINVIFYDSSVLWRAVGFSEQDSLKWIANFIVSTTFPPLLEYFGLSVAYGIYITAAAISIFFVAFFIRETKGMELEQM